MKAERLSSRNQSNPSLFCFSSLRIDTPQKHWLVLLKHLLYFRSVSLNVVISSENDPAERIRAHE